MLVPVRYVDLACPRCQSRHLCAPHECANTAGIHRFRAPGGLRAAPVPVSCPVWPLPGDRPCEALGPNSQGGGRPSQSASSDSRSCPDPHLALLHRGHPGGPLSIKRLSSRPLAEKPWHKGGDHAKASEGRGKLCSALGGFGLPSFRKSTKAVRARAWLRPRNGSRRRLWRPRKARAKTRGLWSRAESAFGSAWPGSEKSCALRSALSPRALVVFLHAALRRLCFPHEVPQSLPLDLSSVLESRCGGPSGGEPTKARASPDTLATVLPH